MKEIILGFTQLVDPDVEKGLALVKAMRCVSQDLLLFQKINDFG